MRVPPYTTKTGIQIGCNYEPRRTWEPSADMEQLQIALIDPANRSAALVFWDAVLWALSIVLIAMLIVGVHYA